MDRRDELDWILEHLPSDVPRRDLAAEISRYVRGKQHNAVRWRIALTLALAVSGLWLSSPLFSALVASLKGSGSGLALLLDWIQAALVGLESFANYTWNGLTGLQTSIADSISASTWLGLAALGLSCLLALDQLLPNGADAEFASNGGLSHQKGAEA
jgi:hypothetical protein